MLPCTHLIPSAPSGASADVLCLVVFFFQAEDGIRARDVTGVQTCALPICRLIGRIFESNGQRVGMTSTDGVYIQGVQIDNGDCSGPRSVRNVLMHPDVDAAVFETARGGVLREGLGFDMCDVAVVTNIGIGDHLGLNYITTVD